MAPAKLPNQRGSSRPRNAEDADPRTLVTEPAIVVGADCGYACTPCGFPISITSFPGNSLPSLHCPNATHRG